MSSQPGRSCQEGYHTFQLLVCSLRAKKDCPHLTHQIYSAVTHPSEPNYVACIGGDYFGMNNDAVNNIPANISSVVDLLEDKGISWGHYEEDMPYTGFQGAQYLNPKTGANDYVRKHSEWYCLGIRCNMVDAET